MKAFKGVILMMIILLGCEKDVNFWDECDRLDQGVVEIVNTSGIDFTVDVTTGTAKVNDPIELSSHPTFQVSTQFQGIYKGEAKVWITFNGETWLHKRVEVIPCEKTYCIINIEDIVR